MPIPADTKQYAAKIARILREHYPDAKCELDYPNPIAVIDSNDSFRPMHR